MNKKHNETSLKVKNDAKNGSTRKFCESAATCSLVLSMMIGFGFNSALDVGATDKGSFSTDFSNKYGNVIEVGTGLTQNSVESIKTYGFSLVDRADDIGMSYDPGVVTNQQKYFGDNRVADSYDQMANLSMHANFLEMRRALEALTGSKVDGETGEGPLYKHVNWSEYSGKAIGELRTSNPRAQDFWSTNYSISYMKDDKTVRSCRVKCMCIMNMLFLTTALRVWSIFIGKSTCRNVATKATYAVMKFHL